MKEEWESADGATHVISCHGLTVPSKAQCHIHRAALTMAQWNTFRLGMPNGHRTTHVLPPALTEAPKRGLAHSKLRHPSSSATNHRTCLHCWGSGHLQKPQNWIYLLRGQLSWQDAVAMAMHPSLARCMRNSIDVWQASTSRLLQAALNCQNSRHKRSAHKIDSDV
mmetsp:Transcript_98802/g.175958  ORF Transcript_98802/g.175958 Transcript_98802/m.175958 type:complete len:166 (-) Transcript_98802:1061-1558(-)